MRTPSRFAGVATAVASLLSALLLGLAMLVLAPAAAHAEQSLVASDPQPQTELERAPGWVNLAFDSPVDAGIAKVLVLDADGKNVTTGELIVEFNSITAQLIDDLPRGTYTVQYRGDDSGSPLGGSFQFSYGPGTFSDDADTTWEGEDSEPEIIKNPDPNATTSQPPYVNPESPDPPPVDPTQEVPGPETSTAAPPSGSSTSPEAGGPEPEPADADSSSSALPWILGGVGILVLAGGATAVYVRTRRPDRP